MYHYRTQTFKTWSLNSLNTVGIRCFTLQVSRHVCWLLFFVWGRPCFASVVSVNQHHIFWVRLPSTATWRMTCTVRFSASDVMRLFTSSLRVGRNVTTAWALLLLYPSNLCPTQTLNLTLHYSFFRLETLLMFTHTHTVVNKYTPPQRAINQSIYKISKSHADDALFLTELASNRFDVTWNSLHCWLVVSLIKKVIKVRNSGIKKQFKNDQLARDCCSFERITAKLDCPAWS